jgi:hypothetical protein
MIDPESGECLRRPEYFEERPLNTSVFEGLSVRILCDITAKVSVPLGQQHAGRSSTQTTSFVNSSIAVSSPSPNTILVPT